MDQTQQPQMNSIDGQIKSMLNQLGNENLKGYLSNPTYRSVVLEVLNAMSDPNELQKVKRILQVYNKQQQKVPMQ